MNKKLFYLSDLHLEILIDKKGFNKELGLFYYDKLFENTFKKNNIQKLQEEQKNSTSENYLLIGGDLILAKHFHYIVPFLEEKSQYFQKIFYIFGNHEYWGKSFNSAFEVVKEQINKSAILKSKMIVLNNNSYNLTEKTKIWGSTLWYKVPPHEEYKIKTVMRDYIKIIENKNGKYNKASYTSFSNRYEEAIFSLKKELENCVKNKQKIIVATHHVPSENYNIISESYYPDVYGYGTLLPKDLFQLRNNHEILEVENGLEDKNFSKNYTVFDCILGMIHGHSHILDKETYLPRDFHYKNEYDLNCYMFTLGYLGYEFLPHRFYDKNTNTFQKCYEDLVIPHLEFE